MVTRNCKHCGTQFETRYSNKHYCGSPCLREAHNKRTRETRAKATEERLNVKSPLLRKAHWQMLYTEMEIIQLAYQNPGYGYTNFWKRVASENARHNVWAIFEIWKEKTGYCLYSHLQDPDSMVTYTDQEWYEKCVAEGKTYNRPRGFGNPSGNNLTMKKKIKRGFSQNSRRNPIKVNPEFEWGDVEPDRERKKR